MHQLIQLPSGLSVNLSLVSRVIPLEDDALEVYFTGGDRVVLKGDDAEAFRRRSGAGGSLSKVKTAIFWLVILTAVVLVYWAVQRRA